MSRFLTNGLVLLMVVSFSSCSRGPDSPASDASAPVEEAAAPAERIAADEGGSPAGDAEEHPGSDADAPSDSGPGGEDVSHDDAAPDAESTLRTLSEFYGQVESLQVDNDYVMHVTGPGIDNQMTTRRKIAAARPNRLSVRTVEGMAALDLVSDGQTLTTYMPMMKQYVQEDAPDSIGEVLESPLIKMQAMSGSAPFILHLLSDDPYVTLMEGVTEAEYVGLVELDGMSAHHLRMIQDQMDWEAWIQSEGDPLLMQISIDMSRMMEQAGGQAGLFGGLKMTAVEKFRDWRINAEVGDDAFVFIPPDDAEQVDSMFGGGGEEVLSPLVGEPAPPVNVELLDGGTLQLSDHGGQDIVMLDFWATWCGPCVEEMPLLAEVAEGYRDKGVVFYAVNQGEEADDVREFLEEQGLALTVALDPDGAVGNAYGVQGIPMLVVIDKLGVVQTVHVGYSSNIRETLQGELDDLLAGKNLAEEALAAYEAEIESEGLEEVWTVRGSYTGVAVDREAGLIYGMTRGQCDVFDGNGKMQRSFTVDHPVDTLRPARLTRGSGLDLIGIASWGQTVVTLRSDGTELWSESGGQGIDDAWAADLDGDGLDEVIVGYNGGTGLHVFGSDGTRRWEFTDIGNVWHVAAGDVNGDGAMEVVTTSATGQVHLFDADGHSLRNLRAPLYASMVRVASTGEEPVGESIFVIGSGDSGEQMIALSGDGDVHWTLDLPASVEHCDSLALADDRPWAAAGLRGGLVMVVDMTDGSAMAQISGLGQRPQVAWGGDAEGAPLLLVAGGRDVRALRVATAGE